VVAKGLYTPNPTSLSAVSDWTLKHPFCFTVSVCVSVNSDVIFLFTDLRFRNHITDISAPPPFFTEKMSLKNWLIKIEKKNREEGELTSNKEQVEIMKSKRNPKLKKKSNVG
jgi:hypothetical protein